MCLHLKNSCLTCEWHFLSWISTFSISFKISGWICSLFLELSTRSIHHCCVHVKFSCPFHSDTGKELRKPTDPGQDQTEKTTIPLTTQTDKTTGLFKTHQEKRMTIRASIPVDPTHLWILLGPVLGSRVLAHRVSEIRVLMGMVGEGRAPGIRVQWSRVAGKGVAEGRVPRDRVAMGRGPGIKAGETTAAGNRVPGNTGPGPRVEGSRGPEVELYLIHLTNTNLRLQVSTIPTPLVQNPRVVQSMMLGTNHLIEPEATPLSPPREIRVPQGMGRRSIWVCSPRVGQGMHWPMGTGKEGNKW